MKKAHLFLVLIAGTILIRCQSPDNSEQSLLDADRAFSAYAGEHGMDSAFIKYADDSARLIRPGTVIKGVEAIRRNMSGAKGLLQWDPDEAFVSKSGDLGTTTGRYTYQLDTLQAAGRYLSVWRRQKDGSWKYLYDLGVPDQP